MDIEFVWFLNSLQRHQRHTEHREFILLCFLHYLCISVVKKELYHQVISNNLIS